MSVAERLQRTLDAATKRNTPFKPVEASLVTSPAARPSKLTSGERASKLARFEAGVGTARAPVPSAQVHASDMTLSQHLPDFDLHLELQRRGIINPAHRDAALEAVRVSVERRRAHLDCAAGSPSANLLCQPFLRDGQSVAPSYKIALKWLQKNLCLNLGMQSLAVEGIPSTPQRPSRPATPLPLKSCCIFEKTAASRAPLPLRVVCAVACLMVFGVSRFKQLQDSRWVALFCVRGVRVIKAINRAEKCRGQGKLARFFWFAGDGVTDYNWISALVEARDLFPDATFALPDWEGSDVFKATKLLNRPCTAAKFRTAFRAVLARTCSLPHPNIFGVASCKKLLSEVAKFRFVSAAWRNELGRWSGALSRGNEFAVPLALLARWEQRQAVMPDIYSTAGVELSICENLVDQVLAIRAHIAANGGVVHLPTLAGWEGITRVDGGVPLLADGPATDARLIELQGPDSEEDEEG
ncbi:hypothetical protein T484DRAFT_1864304 [Baffinella frigidus]|nr:hypothetical protein T484DRAFT_1864304 [Cryptophyta sp. CCMP2293]